MKISRVLWVALVLLPMQAISQVPIKAISIDFNANKLIDPFQSFIERPTVVIPSLRSSQLLTNTSQRNQAIIDEDLRIYQNRQRQKAQRDAILEDAYRSFSNTRPDIQYELRGKDIPGRDHFVSAFKELSEMLEAQKPLSLKRAVFLAENAYDPSIKWEDFNTEIESMVTHLGFKMQQDKVDPNDAVAKNMTLFQFFTDTLEVNYTGYEKPVVSYPMFYDFEDFWGQKDIRSVFVSKLLKTGTGQCHSLPLLYLILAAEIDAKAHLAFSPSHSYVKFQDNAGNWHNVELTNQMLTSDQFITYSGYVKAEALINKLYMTPLSDKEVIAQSLNDLAMSYASKYGYDDFVKMCTDMAYKHGLKSMSIHKLNFNYYLAKHNLILNQYKQYGLTRQDFEADEEAMKAYRNLVGAQKHIEKLGYADMPAEQYERWLNSVKAESRKQEHKNKMRTLMGNTGNR